MSQDIKKKNKATPSKKKEDRKLIENKDFTWAGWPKLYAVPLFTWDELNEILEDNNNKIPEDMWKERLKRK